MGPVCLPQSRDLPLLSAQDDAAHGRYALQEHICVDSALCASNNAYNWTHSSPCIKSPSSGQEIRVFSDSAFAEGRGISLITTASRASFIASQVAFTKPPTQSKGTNQDLVRTVPAKYEVKDFPGKGKGLVAGNRIRRGELIMANTASLMIDYRSFEELAAEEYQALQASAVELLPGAHEAAIMMLSTHDDAANLTRTDIVNKILVTNSFDIEPENEDDEQEHGFFAVFPEISRMNHDCRPNADYYFDYETMTQFIHASRDIAPGEELTLTYHQPLLSRRERLRH